MILHPENWMNIRRFRALHEAGASYAEIAAEVGCDWRTVKKYLAQGSPAVPPAARRARDPAAQIGPFAGLVESWLRADITLRASVICERLTPPTGSPAATSGSSARGRGPAEIAAELAASDENPLAGLHRRFEVVPAQAQVDWGEESGVLIGTPKVYSFHMVLSYSRDPFCCYTARTDLATFFACHIRAFEYFGGCPARWSMTGPRPWWRHVAPGRRCRCTRRRPRSPPLRLRHLRPGRYRPMEGRVERQVDIVRVHALPARVRSLTEMDAASPWAVIRRGQVHRTHAR